MVDLLALPWRAYPAAVLVLVGSGLVATGLGAGFGGGRRQRGGPERALGYLYLFRRVVVGLALVGAGLAWAGQVPWLLAACVCIGVGELLESSYYIGVLRWGQRRGDSRLSPAVARGVSLRA